jgi:DNA-binding MarR family transcriptional regulator
MSIEDAEAGILPSPCKLLRFPIQLCAVHTSIGSLLIELVESTHTLSRIATVDGENTSPATWRTLEVLQESSPKRLGELASLARVGQPTMTAIIGSLVKSGLAVRVADPSDARAQLIDITPAGGDAIDGLRARAASALEPYFADLSDDDLDVLNRAVAIVDRVTAADHDNAHTESTRNP